MHFTDRQISETCVPSQTGRKCRRVIQAETLLAGALTSQKKFQEARPLVEALEARQWDGSEFKRLCLLHNLSEG